MFVRYIVADPEPRDPKDDTLVFQIPENSRNEELFVWMCEQTGVDYVKVEFTPKAKPSRDDGPDS